MINANRYRHAGRTYVIIFRAGDFEARCYLGLTPQAMSMPRLRR
jgi:hypothetical protein